MEGGMMAPPEPPPPDPVQIAVTELGSQLAEQAADVAEQLAEQERDLSNQLNILDAVMQRSMQIEAEMSGVPPEQVGEPVGLPQGAAGPPVGPEMGVEGPMAQVGPEMGVEGPMAQEMATEAGPAMEEAAQLQDPEAFESTAIGSMATNPDLRSTVAMYVPVLEQSLDHLSRILMTLWIQEDRFRAELGENDFSELEERLRTVLDNLGSLVLRINQTAMAAQSEENEMAAGP